ncbi:LemA family protein [Natrinema salsiterrestre]|uniref:LemA family protein n=1 Tax=Natrinema salsiterrestre TaxID=2950540 RepID=A0A9Q4Q2I7_9EURY|nr:LemA family protein [Natrinema salsiterrestre]MDF9744947.1 LemA family protein [Natrinema salsiterrestre]
MIAGFGALVVGYSVVRYLSHAQARLAEAHERCEKTWADIEVLLERRRSELEQLIDLTNEHVSHERDLLEGLIEAREGAIDAQSPEEAASVAVSLRETAREVYALSDEYPELASNDRFEELSDSIQRLEQRIEDRRERYNEAVAAYNVLLNTFPESVFAARRGFTRRQPFVASRGAHEGVDVGDRLDGGATTET